MQQREPLRDLVVAAQKAAAFYAHYSQYARARRAGYLAPPAPPWKPAPGAPARGGAGAAGTCIVRRARRAPQDVRHLRRRADELLARGDVVLEDRARETDDGPGGAQEAVHKLRERAPATLVQREQDRVLHSRSTRLSASNVSAASVKSKAASTVLELHRATQVQKSVVKSSRGGERRRRRCLGDRICGRGA